VIDREVLFIICGGEMMSNVVRVNIHVSAEVHQYYKELAKRSGVSMSAVMSMTLTKNMDDQRRLDAVKG